MLGYFCDKNKNVDMETKPDSDAMKYTAVKVKKERPPDIWDTGVVGDGLMCIADHLPPKLSKLSSKTILSARKKTKVSGTVHLLKAMVITMIHWKYNLHNCRPSDSHGFTVSGVIPRSHSLTSKSHGEPKRLRSNLSTIKLVVFSVLAWQLYKFV